MGPGTRSGQDDSSAVEPRLLPGSWQIGVIGVIKEGKCLLP